MIKHILRRTEFKEFDKETQDLLLQLMSDKCIIKAICACVWSIAFLILVLPPLIICACNASEISTTACIAMELFALIVIIIFSICTKKFSEVLIEISETLSEKMYFAICTKKGKALSKKDFKIIKKYDEILYEYISKQDCRTYCYETCFRMCKVLKKGEIEFVAIKALQLNQMDINNAGKEFAMHALYINNGWVFDSYNVRQYRVAKIHQIYGAKVYRKFTFEEIQNKYYEQFREEQYPDLAKWCAANDCTEYWMVND